MSVSIRFMTIAVGAVALALAVGCGQPPEEKTAASSQAKGPKKAPSSSAPSGVAQSPSVVTSDKLPANFPQDIPQHPDAKVLESRATSDLGMSVVMTVDDDASEVSSYYADSLAAEGWSTDIRNMPDGNTVFADKGNRTVAVLVTEGRKGSEVRMILGHH